MLHGGRGEARQDISYVEATSFTAAYRYDPCTSTTTVGGSGVDGDLTV